jgi:hypothetical protein
VFFVLLYERCGRVHESGNVRRTWEGDDVEVRYASSVKSVTMYGFAGGCGFGPSTFSTSS